MAKKLNILIATGIMPPAIGGPALYTVELTKQFRALGHSVKIVTYGDKQNVESWAKDNVLIVPRVTNMPIRYWRYFILLYRQALEADLIYAHDLVSTGLPATLVKVLQPKKKLVIRLGGDFLWEKAYNQAWTNKPLSQYYQQKKNFKEKIYLMIYKLVLNRADHIIYSTKWQTDLSVKFLAVDSDKASIINNPFPRQRQIENNTRDNNLLLAGRLIPLKNIATIIKIMPQLPGLNLRIVGSGPQKNELLNLTKNLQLEKRVNFLDGVPAANLTKIIAQSYLVLVPSISDISPNIVLESMAMHKPVVVTKECGYYYDHQDQLMFIDPFDQDDIIKKITNLLNTRNYRAYQKKLEQIDMGHSWKVVAQEHLDLFMSLVK